MGKKYAILLVYSNICKQSVIESFVFHSKLILGSDCTILVVENNLSSVFNYKASGDVTFITGDNTLSEFSGWAKGIDYIKKCNIVNEGDIFLFGNDTFNNHRSFSVLDSLLFKWMASKLKKPEPVIIGEVCRTNRICSLDGMAFSSWVSTYLFMANVKMVKRFSEAIVSGRECIERVTDKYISFSNKRVCSELSAHINSWLRPVDQQQHSWYKSHSDDLELIYRKAEAILNEKRLSAITVNSNGRLYSVYDSMLGDLIKKVGWSIYYRRRKL
ncbi:hypothetical protein [Shewanella marisflavi]|uniref:Uncharacterized protein n=1 Tax=Shewanella marisflavi TaxID=260364 RepID=A0AAC9TZY0_9GAMM|nr:hypothetical protein [Shewanella marisflavi]ASJ97325.1 hypothetical protein CFF01_12465 [Shewanella marisflavi]